jgi:translation initiation factor IF-3
VKDLAAKKWLTNDDVEFVRCVLVRADRENDGLSSKEAVDMIQELQPDLTREGT